MIKKVLLLLLLFILPFSVYAKEANLELKSIEKVEASSDTVEVSHPTIESSTLSYNLKFTNTNEFIKYKLEIINHDDIDYEIALESDDEYLSYEISEKEISANKTVETIITIKYTKEMPLVERGEQKVNTSTVVIKDDQGEVVTPTPIENPYTGSYLILIPLLIILAVVIVLFRTTKANKIFLLLLLIIPAIVHAAVNLIFTFKVSYEIEPENKLRYRDELINMDEVLNSEKKLLQNACTSKDNKSNIEFEPTSESSANIIYTFNKEDNIEYQLTVSVEETNGELSSIVGECISAPNIKYDNFSYNGREVKDNSLILDFNEKMCSKARNVIESISPECIYNFINPPTLDNTLRYKGQEISADTVLQDLENNLESVCITNNYNIDTNITYEVTSENSADIVYTIDENDDIKYITSVSIETDAASGDSVVNIGSCAPNPNMKTNNFTYQGKTINNINQLKDFNNSVCTKLRNILNSIDVECTKKIIAITSADNILRYRGSAVNPTTLTNQLKYELETMCSTGNYFFGDIWFEPTSSKSANITYIFNEEDLIKYDTQVSIEEDAETGDSRSVVGECIYNPQMVYNKFTYNGKVIGNLSQLTDFNNSMCAGIRETFESLDLECVESFIRGPK